MNFKSFAILVKPLKEKSIVWFKKSNTYVLVAHDTAQIITQYFEDCNQTNGVSWILKHLELSENEAQKLMTSVIDLIDKVNVKNDVIDNEDGIVNPVSNFKATKYYRINNTAFKVDFENADVAFLIHPKFKHLEVKAISKYNHHFEVFLKEGKIVLKTDEGVIGTWPPEETHFFQGKFSMKLVAKLYGKSESNWLGVFHASALSDGHKNIMFLGDSGNGKSTLAALLVSQGYTLFADDFVPVEAKSQHIYYFPAAISIKEKAFSILNPLFPQLKETPQIDLKYINKSVRYLVAPKPEGTFKTHLPCKQLVFVKYQKGSGLKLSKLNSEVAFEQLIPDSWLSPEPQNAPLFLDWFTSLTCYSLIYSDNELMYHCVKKLYKGDL
jgi:hypothetical protein